MANSSRARGPVQLTILGPAAAVKMAPKRKFLISDDFGALYRILDQATNK